MGFFDSQLNVFLNFCKSSFKLSVAEAKSTLHAQEANRTLQQAPKLRFGDRRRRGHLKRHRASSGPCCRYPFGSACWTQCPQAGRS